MMVVDLTTKYDVIKKTQYVLNVPQQFSVVFIFHHLYFMRTHTQKVLQTHIISLSKCLLQILVRCLKQLDNYHNVRRRGDSLISFRINHNVNPP